MFIFSSKHWKTWLIRIDIYMAATVLIAERLFPNTQGHIPTSQLNDLLDQADRVLQGCEPYLNVVQKCRATLKLLDEKVKSSVNTDRGDDPPAQTHARDKDRPVNDVLLEGTDFEFGPGPFNMSSLDDYSFNWNRWPISFGDLGNEGLQEDTQWAPFEST